MITHLYTNDDPVSIRLLTVTLERFNIFEIRFQLLTCTKRNAYKTYERLLACMSQYYTKSRMSSATSFGLGILGNVLIKYES
jgi:hypothetical protein